MLRCTRQTVLCYSGRNVFSVSLTVEPEDSETTILGKQVSDLQTGIVVNDTFITGALNYVTGYTGYSEDPELQEGYFLALKCEATEDSTTTVELVGGSGSAVELDEDMNVVIRITNTREHSVRFVTTTEDGVAVEKTFELSMLELIEE